MILSVDLVGTTTRVALSRVFPWREAHGNAAIEFAFLLPVFLLMFLGIVEFGRLLWTQSTLQHAVEAGARYAAINDPTCSGTQTATYTTGQLFGLSASPTITFKCQTCGTQVKATVSFTSVVPALLPFLQNITLSAQSCFPAFT